MPVPQTKFIVFNAAAALIGVAAVAAAIKSVLMPTLIPPCSERYHSLTRFSLERGGVMLTAADLQAGLGGKDAGVIESVGIAPVKDGPAPLAMGVTLQKATVSQTGVATEFKGGTSFAWQPRALQGKSAACLSYHVMLPADFDFHRGGALPGLFGSDGADKSDGFLAGMAWRPTQGAGVTVRVTENGKTGTMPAEYQTIELPRGRWVKLEQEVVVNSLTNEDGILRLWVDGVLQIERTDLSYRAQPAVAISGVSVDVFRGNGPDDAQAAAAKDAVIRVTPFEVRWPQ